jgi:hypothetical protein
MRTGRSPNYPSVGLEQAVRDARAIYQKYGRNPIDPDAAAKAWGYNTLSGPARQRIASLRQYGLIDQQVNGPLRMSPRALTLILRAPDSAEYGAMLRDAALTPPLFRHLYDDWLNEPDDGLLHYLIAERRFSPDGAQRAMAAFRDTTEFAGLTEPDTIAGHGTDTPSPREDEPMMSVAPTNAPPAREARGMPLEDSSIRSVQLPLPGTKWATLQVPYPLSEAAWQQMLAVLKVMKPGLVSPTVADSIALPGARDEGSGSESRPPAHALPEPLDDGDEV